MCFLILPWQRRTPGVSAAPGRSPQTHWRTGRMMPPPPLPARRRGYLCGASRVCWPRPANSAPLKPAATCLWFRSGRDTYQPNDRPIDRSTIGQQTDKQRWRSAVVRDQQTDEMNKRAIWIPNKLSGSLDTRHSCAGGAGGKNYYEVIFFRCCSEIWAHQMWYWWKVEEFSEVLCHKLA
jgi:hypothetical protein